MGLGRERGRPAMSNNHDHDPIEMGDDLYDRYGKPLESEH